MKALIIALCLAMSGCVAKGSLDACTFNAAQTKKQVAYLQCRISINDRFMECLKSQTTDSVELMNTCFGALYFYSDFCEKNL